MGYKKAANTPEDLWKYVDRRGHEDCWPWLKEVHPNTGYGYMTIKYKRIGVHRIAYAATLGAIPPGMYVLHSCDNRRCCNPAHLHLGTHADNMREMVERKRSPIGSRHAGAKLTEDDVEIIRSLLLAGETQAAIGQKFGVKRETISAIARRVNWRNLPWGDPEAQIPHREPPHGEANNAAKLTEDQVREIRSRAARGETGTALAREFGIAQTAASAIIRRQTWRHVN